MKAEIYHRLMAMQAAEKNILDLKEELLALFREQRQAAITNELLDIVSGFEALSEDIITYLASFTRTGIPFNPNSILWETWSSEEGGAKRILFDADDIDSIIGMSYE